MQNSQSIITYALALLCAIDTKPKRLQ